MSNILAADIGGTNSRFAHFQQTADGRLVRVASVWLKTQASTSFDHLCRQLEAGDLALPLDQYDAAVFAVAGPVENGAYSNPPHISWDLNLSETAPKFGLQRYRLINDFVAQAYACRSPVIESARQILTGDAVSDAPLAVVGAGTGLGQAALLVDEKGFYHVLPSEGGHSSFPFQKQSELGFMQFLLRETGGDYVETETIASGKGLSLVHQFLSGEKLAPAEVAARLTSDSRTLSWMARFLGRVCRNYALQVLARGGLYIAGGVIAKTPELVMHPEFEKTFRSSQSMARVLEKIPVFLNDNEESGLWGAAVLGQQMLSNEQPSK